MTHPLLKLSELGQSLWLDYISRRILEDGSLAGLVRAGEIRGVTSNPSIFEKSIAEGAEYRPILARLLQERPRASAFELYETVAVRDIQDAADLLRGVYESTQARDGNVSLEVTMHKGEDAAAILAEARHLWQRVARPNLMVKVPGTPSGIEAFEQLIAEGINVNVTLLFSVETCAAVAQAYLRGLTTRSRQGGDLSRVASVASFFVSRIDTSVDKLLEAKGNRALQGRIAVASAKLAHARCREIFSGKAWKALEKKGARMQRMLWASTGTKNKAYSDVLYVEELIARDTVNTAPPATIDAFRDHGKPRESLIEGLDAARAQLAELKLIQISLDAVTDQLLAEGLKLFSDAFVKLLATIESARAQASPPDKQRWLPTALEQSVDALCAEWASEGKLARLWNKDASLWTGADEDRWLSWLEAPAVARGVCTELTAFAAEIRQEGFTHVLLLGMGGSSLAPEVLMRTFGAASGFPRLEVVDSTDPQQIAASERRVDLKRTLVLVASKSGSTLEPSIFEAYFRQRVQRISGERAGRQFVAITDPGSKLEKLAREQGYRRIFPGVPSIGGRFSALSNFGLVPAALIGVDLGAFQSRVESMAAACGARVSPESNPGASLGLSLGAAARAGRDKLTIVCSPTLSGLGAWLEQLVAESTGKLGRGIIPLDLEPLAGPEKYAADRLFVHIRDQSRPDASQDAAVDALARAGQAVLRISVPDALSLGAEFFRWEIATAVAGAVLGIHPFDQPDVEASKVVTRELTSAFEQSGSLPAEKPFFIEGAITLHSDERNVAALKRATGPNAELADVLRAHIARLGPGDYFALLAYIEMNPGLESQLQSMRRKVRDATRAATCLGFGPRFLHSTGQAYKGGPNTGVFLQLTARDSADLPVPGAAYSFGVVKAAQARGDFAVLSERSRRALRVHIDGELASGLAALDAALSAALHHPATVRN